MKTSPMPTVPTHKKSKEEWMKAYPGMTEQEAMNLVKNPPEKVDLSQEPDHDSPM